ncbi:MAG TPA: hypothetical protein VD999_00335 [Vitreimonas sp.]|nr:hypothetical protein [Vitreimonas sp.]
MNPLDHKLNIKIEQTLYSAFSQLANRAGLTKINLLRQWLLEDENKPLLLETQDEQNQSVAYSFFLDHQTFTKLEKKASLLGINTSLYLKLLIKAHTHPETGLAVQLGKQHQFYIPTQFMKIYQGKADTLKTYQRILKSKYIKAYTQLDKIWPLLPENYDDFADAARMGTTIHNLNIGSLNSRQKEQQFKKLGFDNYEGKFLPFDPKWNFVDLLITDRKVAIIQSSPQLRAIEINHHFFHKHLFMLHDYLWRLLPT